MQIEQLFPVDIWIVLIYTILQLAQSSCIL